MRLVVPRDAAGGATDTYDPAGADVLQAINWAQSRVPDPGTYAVALVRDQPGPTGPERGLVWLVGIDGNTSPAKLADDQVLRRMEQRRIAPVVLPPGARLRE